MLRVSNLAKSYADNLILQDISFNLNAGDRVGLIGPNGGGKTTLLRLIVGDDKPEQGSVFIDQATRVGYMRQGLEFVADATLADVLHDPRDEVVGTIEHLAEVMATDHLLMQAYQAAVDRLEALGGYPDQSVRDNILMHLGLEHVPTDTLVSTLSGGQKTRLGLAQVLLTQPNLLLLDEPTNHLDLPMLAWLEDWLHGFDGAALIVSHDRVFLDRTVDRILSIDPHSHTVREYAGNYTDYLEQSLAEREKQWQAYGDQQAEIRRMQQDIVRAKAQAARSEWQASSVRRGGPLMKLKGFKDYTQSIAKGVARKAKSREKKLERYLESDERVPKPKQSWQMKVDFDQAASGRDVLHLTDVSVGYGQNILLRHITQTIRRGERVALIGANGSGKSTLIKTIAGQLQPLSGEVHLGASVRLGYFAQEQDILDPNSTPLRSLQTLVTMNDTEARNFLHYFLFTGDQPLTANHLLSYGERARLMLALLVAQGCNFLLLDEPINHLDIPSRTQFEQALTNFEGTALAVVHDRYFIQGFATRVWAVEDEGVSEYLELADAE